MTELLSLQKMNLTEWKAHHGVTTSIDYEEAPYIWTAETKCPIRPSTATAPYVLAGWGSTEYAACYALARKLEVEPPTES